MATWNAVEMTRTALTSLRGEAGFPYRLILVDNSDQPEAREYFRKLADTGEFGETMLIQNEENIGWLRATNIGLRNATGEFVCLLNNDVICGRDWLKNCVDLMRRNPEVGLVNPRGNERSENVRVRDINQYALRLERENAGLHTELDHCSGFCMVAWRRLIDQIGILDETFEGGYYEDVDFSRRAQQAGYRCAQCDTAFVLHLGGQSFRRVPEERARLNERNRLIAEQRWGKTGRILLLLQHPRMTPDELMALVVRNKVYLVLNRFVPASALQVRHENLVFLESRVVSSPLYFLWKTLYLSSKRRIDEARVMFG